MVKNLIAKAHFNISLIFKFLPNLPICKKRYYLYYCFAFHLQLWRNMPLYQTQQKIDSLLV